MMVKVRALRDNVTTQNATLMSGDVGECPDDRAKVLVGRGEAELVEGELRMPGAAFATPAGAERATSRGAARAERRSKGADGASGGLETIVIRLLAPVRAGKDILPHNAVVEVVESEALKLLDYDPPLAEETDTFERYPVNQPVLKIHDYPVTGSEKFPLDPDRKSNVTPAMFSNEFDRQTAALIQNSGPAPDDLSKERPPAKIEVTKEMEKAGPGEGTAEAAAHATTRVVVVEEDGGKDKVAKGKGKGA